MQDQDLIQKAIALLPEGQVYCDWAASALPLPAREPTFIPPHHASSEVLDKARAAVREFLHDPDENYHILFTAGTTASFQLLANRIPWSCKDSFICHRHVHNSVLGIRNVALSRGAEFHSLSTEDVENSGSSKITKSEGFAVFAFPGECNLTGCRYPMAWAEKAKSTGVLGYPPKKTITIVDTAKLVASTHFFLTYHPYIDALVFSLYKLSSTYTGLGVLVIRKNSLLELLLHSTASSSYFGGQSSEAITPFSNMLHVPSPSLEKSLSSGTPHLQALHGLPHQLRSIGHVLCEQGSNIALVGKTFRTELERGFPKVKFYGDGNIPSADCTTSFTLYRGSAPIGHHEVATILSLNRIHVRAGTMCNIGATASVLGLSDRDLVELHRQGHRCGEGVDVVNGRPTGVVRVSFGWGSSYGDAYAVVDVLINFFGTGIKRPLTSMKERIVKNLYLYPVKGCSGIKIDQATCTKGTFRGNRCLAVVDKCGGKVLDVKSCPQLSDITATVTSDENDRPTLLLRSFSKDILLPLKEMATTTLAKPCSDQNTCGITRAMTMELQDLKAEDWLYEILGRSVRLAILQGHKEDVLVVTEGEIRELECMSGIEREEVIRAVRPNIVLTGDGVSADILSLTGPVVLTRIRKCTRCTVVNIIAGKSNNEPLLSIAQMCRRRGGGLVCGAIMRVSPGYLRVGDVLNSNT